VKKKKKEKKKKRRKKEKGREVFKNLKFSNVH